MLHMQAIKQYLKDGVIKITIPTTEKVEEAYIMSVGNKDVGFIIKQTSDLFTKSFKSVEIPHHKGYDIFKYWWMSKVNDNSVDVYLIPKRVVDLSEDVVLYDIANDKEIVNPILEFYNDFMYYKSMANLYMLKLHKRFNHVRRAEDVTLPYKVVNTRR